MKILLAALLLIACNSEPEVLNLKLQPKLPDWVPPGAQVEVTPDGKVVMTADLARAMVAAAELRQRDYLLHNIAMYAELGQRSFSDEYPERVANTLAEDMQKRGFKVTNSPSADAPGWWILEVSW